MRRIQSINSRNPLATGRTAEIYPWGEGRVLKLYRDWYPPHLAEYEARIGRAVQAAGLPVPAVGEVVEVAGRRGLVYERVDGPSLAEVLRARPWTLFRVARLLAELQATLHAGRGTPELPAQREVLARKIQAAEPLAPALREAALRAFDRLPDGEQVCHGDFHVENVLLAARGPVVIDWIDATRGNPAADVARTSVLLLGPLPPERRLEAFFVRWFHAAYLRHYWRLRPEGREQYPDWLPIVAAGRLSENIADQQEWLVEVVRKRLEIGD